MTEGLTLGLIIGAALLDSINPCVFGVLIFLIAFMTKMFKSKNRMLLGGLFYTAVVYVTYLVLGLGFLKITVGLGFSVIVYWIAALIAIVAGMLEVKDYFNYGKGFSLQMIPGASKRIHMYTKQMAKVQKKHPALSFLMAGVLGVFVVLVELPCTGAPYLAILALIGQGSYAQALPLLLLYNLIFVLPLFVIIGIGYFGTSSKKLESWRQESRGLMRLAVGLFLIALGMYMIYSIAAL
jgi:cytochrome c biogenesis protein CcdA